MKIIHFIAFLMFISLITLCCTVEKINYASVDRAVINQKSARNGFITFVFSNDTEKIIRQ